jgi:mono/diheme cytochrome c family protein
MRLASWRRALLAGVGRARAADADFAKVERGRHLVAVGHCVACHTPKDFLGANQSNDALHGCDLQSWFAPSLGSDLRRGLGAWSQDEVITLRKAGRNARTEAYVPMSEVIQDSTSKLTDADLKAVAVYLKDQPPSQAPKVEPPPQQVVSAGQAVYADACSACHRMGGEGVPGMFPPLKGDSVVQQADPTTVVRLIVNGGRAATTGTRPTPFSMPAFGWKLDDAQIAAVATYVRGAWGNSAPAVAADRVKDLREAVKDVGE